MYADTEAQFQYHEASFLAETKQLRHDRSAWKQHNWLGTSRLAQSEELNWHLYQRHSAGCLKES
jgi:hypothetical protein